MREEIWKEPWYDCLLKPDIYETGRQWKLSVSCVSCKQLTENHLWDILFEKSGILPMFKAFFCLIFLSGNLCLNGIPQTFLPLVRQSWKDRSEGGTSFDLWKFPWNLSCFLIMLSIGLVSFSVLFHFSLSTVQNISKGNSVFHFTSLSVL